MKTRMRGLILFLVIVWSIALTFLLLEQGSQELWIGPSGPEVLPRTSACRELHRERRGNAPLRTSRQLCDHRKERLWVGQTWTLRLVEPVKKGGKRSQFPDRR